MSENFWNIDSLNYAAFAIPAFFIFTGLEYVIACKQKKSHLFKFDSSVANISIGVAERLLNLFITASFYAVFQFVFQNYALFSIPNTFPVWIAILLATDLIWYWYHRLGHEVNLLWAAHIIHHQSDEFNYTVSARITTLQAIVRNAFWCLLPLAGFHPNIVVVTLVIHGTYSFFTHTQLIPKLGWLEYIFITPSHHRVHHASNEKYLNKNYGDLFVFWDKIFGTFQKEEEQPVYGLTHPLKSYSFIWQHVQYFMEIIEAVRREPKWKKKFGIVFGRPESLDQEIRNVLERKYLSRSRLSNTSLRHKKYVHVQLVITAALLFFVSVAVDSFSAIDLFFLTALILITLINCGALLEQKTWIYYLEQIRFVIMAGYFGWLIDEPYFALIAGIASLAICSRMTFRRWLLKIIYQT